LTTGITACDVYTPAHFHATPEVIPVALALAEELHVTGKDLVTAVAAGLEVACRIAGSIDNAEFRRRGWHSPGVVGPLGAAATAAKLLKLDATGVRRAIALAFSQASGTFASWPTTAVKFHQARGAAAGLMGGLLAGEEFESALEPLDAPDGGLYATYAPGDSKKVVENLGTHWELLNISLRRWPGATPIQALLTALLTYTSGPLPTRDQIKMLTILVPSKTYKAHESSEVPKTTFEALLSFHYIAASVIEAGYFWIDLVAPGRIGDAVIRDFIAQKVRLVADDSIPMGGVAVYIDTIDGKQMEIRKDAALGTPSNPLTAEQLHEKFLKGSEGRLPAGAATILLHALMEPEKYLDSAEITALMRPVADEGSKNLNTPQNDVPIQRTTLK
jgi:2-methylcitrate dehydratase PrpD